MTALLEHLRSHHTPTRLLAALRALVRTDFLWLVFLSALSGVLAGLCVAAMTQATLLAHRLIAPDSGRLSGLASVSPWRVLCVPVAGGLLLGWWQRRLNQQRRRRPVDPIEANALHGGRMSLADSLVVAGQTVLSNGCGASLGLEAGFSQMGSAIASRIGRILRLHRADVRLLVGCGAAGAIGAAFDAPLAGAFYAFELIIGSYAFTLLAPVASATLCALAVTRLAGASLPAVTVAPSDTIPPLAWPLLAVLGVTCAYIGIVLMKSAAQAETLFRQILRQDWLRPALGGLLVGALALISPSVLSSGHMAMRARLVSPPGMELALALLCLKALATVLSIGAGFRGGLFFASLYLGVLAGAVFAGLVAPFAPLPLSLCTVAGMGALATAVIGAPLTMILLALETTHSAGMTASVALAAIAASLTVRRSFGYTFATWRFHLRGENIRSGVDIGWLRALTVAHMMRTETDSLPADEKVETARATLAGWMPRHIVLHDEHNHYQGMVDTTRLMSIQAVPERPLSSLAEARFETLSPETCMADAVAAFERTGRPALAVVDKTGRVMGLLSERYVLRRYAEELERIRRDLAGEKHIRYTPPSRAGSGPHP
ncbi:MAG: chloride channel protein [Acetobacter papayae]|uniref:chloride channel protein n=1 Tax=Acetobacter papayae TaxID=1076592 RepID=UPI0039E85B4C